MLVAVGVGGEILAQALPGVAAVGRFEQVIAAVIDGLGIVRRNHHRRVPLEAVARRLIVIFQRPDGFRFAGAQIAARKIAVLRFGVNDIGVGRIDAIVESVAALHRDPVFIADAVLLRGRTGAAPGVIILQAAADVIGLLDNRTRLRRIGRARCCSCGANCVRCPR